MATESHHKPFIANTGKVKRISIPPQPQLETAISMLVNEFEDQALGLLEQDIYIFAKVKEFCQAVSLDRLIKLLKHISKEKQFDLHMICGSKGCHEVVQGGGFCNASKMLDKLENVELIIVPEGVKKNLMMIDQGTVILDIDYSDAGQHRFEGPISHRKRTQGKKLIKEFNRLKDDGFAVIHSLTSEYSEKALLEERKAYKKKVQKTGEYKGLYVGLVGSDVAATGESWDTVNDTLRERYGMRPVLIRKVQ